MGQGRGAIAGGIRGGSIKANPTYEAWCQGSGGRGGGGAQLLQVFVAQQSRWQSAAQLVSIRKAAAHENKG